jgi:pimeloyl-ACP methyl ester carboxylesterase
MISCAIGNTMTTQSHYIPVELRSYGKKTIAHWAINPTGKAIIFVHGFGGKSIATWTHFSSMLRLESDCSGHDIIFLGYEGLYAQAEFSATFLYSFLNLLFTSPLSIIQGTLNPSASRRPDFQYDEVTLVAHSLGAVVTRRALLIAHEQGNNWMDKTKMVLFAPAHMGAHITNLGSLLTGPLRLLYGFFQARFQVTYDLTPGSSTLTNLLNDTTNVLNTGSGSFVVAKKVIWPEIDNIVIQMKFASDPSAKPYLGRNHINVCKPDLLFRDPVKDVIEVVK